MSYNMTFLDNATTLPGIVSNIVNTDVIGFPLAALLLLAIWIIMLASTSSYEFVKSWIVSNFITSILALLMMFIGWIQWGYAVVPVILLLIGIVYNYFR